MQSMWLQILIVLQIVSLINFVHSQSSHPNINFKWWRKHHEASAHKRLIDEMSPSQLSRFQEEYNDNKIPRRHANKFSKLDQVVCSHIPNCGALPAKKEVSEVDTITVSPKNREPELESRLRSIRRSKPRRLDIDNESPVVEDLNDFAAVPANRSHLQEMERRKSADEFSPISKIKMEIGGNKSSVDLLFHKYYKLDSTPVHQTLEEIHCKKPTPVIVSVSEFYRHPHKIYAPPCAKLFQCTERSGCCTEPKRCTTSKSENVTLYFRVYTQVQGRGEVITMEALTFLNDTECHCQNMSKSKPATDNRKHLETDLQDESRSECTCPAPYSKRTMNDGTCICDCFYTDTPCLRHKRGGLTLNSSEKKCVEIGRCTKPTCEHGDYLVTSGRCPKNPRLRRQ